MMSVFGRHRLAGSRPRAFINATSLLLGLALFLPGVTPRADVSDLAVVEYEFVGQSRVGRMDFDYTYRITIRNDGEALANVRAVATSTSRNTSIRDGDVDAGAIPAGAMVTPDDTFTFRQNRRFRFNPSSIVWNFTADPGEPANTPPVAEAGPDQALQSGNRVQLDGSGSTDAEGDPLSYAWQLTELPAGSTAELDDPTSVMPGFVADRPGNYVVRLVVNDGEFDSAADLVVVSSQNTPPVADAGLDQTVPVGGTAQFFGAGSFDANGDALTYRWRLAARPAESSAALDSTSGENTSFVVDVAGEYAVELVVNDGYVDSAPDTALVTTSNSPPVADAGDDQEVEAGETVTLDGEFSFDVDDDPLEFFWSLLSRPAGSAAELATPLGPSVQFMTDVAGLYVAQLIVNDGSVDSAPDTAVITAVAANQAPLAAATASPSQPAPGDTIQLDGSPSSDPDGDELTYLWTLLRPAGSGATLSSATAVSPSFVADVEGTYTASLVVNDGELDSAPAAVIVTAATDNNPPALVAVGDRVTFVGASLAFRIFAVDPDAGDTLAFSLVSAPAGASIDPASGDFLYNAGGSPALVPVTVRVTDSGGLSDSYTFSIDVRSAPFTPTDNEPPTLAPIGSRTVVIGQSLSIQTDASDPDAGDILSYALPAAPSGMTLSPSGLIEWTPAAAQVGAHDVTVEVTDAAGAAALQSAIVNVVAPNRAPVAIDDLYEARIGETASVAAPGVLANDSDPDGDPLSASLVTTTANGTLDFRADGSFDYTPGLPETIGPVELELQCELPISAGGFQHNGTIAVGDVDNDGETELVGYNFITSAGRAELWVLNAADCTPELPTSPAVVAAGGLSQGSHPGLLDIDGDGDLEIIAPREALPQDQGGYFDSRHLLAVHHDGTLAWPGDGGSETSPILGFPTAGSSSGSYRYTGPTFADLDADGVVEIVMPWRIIGSTSAYGQSGVTVYDSRDGSIEWEFTGPDQFGDADYKPPVVADLDRDGTMEIILHTQVVDHLGGLEFELPVEGYLGGSSRITTNLYSAVADFDGDTFAEIVAYDQQNVYLFEQNGTLIWQQPFANNGQSQLTVADLDGDGEVEFAFLAGTGNSPGYMVAFDTDGQQLWSHAGNSALSPPAINRFTGPNITAWDANADGAADLVVHYDNGVPADTGIYIFDGRDGSVLEFVTIDSYFTEQRFITIADIDDDGTAELISSFNTGGTGTTRVWRGTSANPLPPAPGVRNQWIFDQTRIDDAANVLAEPEPAWLQPGRNGYNLVSDPQRVYTQTQCELPFSPDRLGTNGTLAVGDVDNDGDTEIVGMSWITRSFTGEFFILNAEDCSVQLGSSPLVQAVDVGGVRVGSHLGLLDIDGDGDLEMIAHRLRQPNGGFDPTPSLIAAHHDGTLAWPGNGGSEPTGRTYLGYSESTSGPTFADLDGDGAVEILVSWNVFGCGPSVSCAGVTVFNSADGSLKWEYEAEPQRNRELNQPVAVVDLDLDGTMEVIVHNHVVSHDGEFEFRLPIRDAFTTTPGQGLYLHTAVANFDDDPYPEIIGRSRDWTYLFEHDGTLAWEIARETPSTSAIAVADFDGDGQVEFGWMDGDYSIFSSGLPRYLAVFDTDGTPLWSHADRDRFQEPSGFAGGALQGVVAFDANADGAYDMVVHLNAANGNGLYIFSGRDGSLLEFIPVDRYAPFHRFPTIADVDGDGAAEIVTSFNGGLNGTVRVIGGIESKPLPPAPPVRTQWIFHEGYVDADGKVLTNPTPHWLRPELNGWNLIRRAPDPLAGTTDAFTYQVSDGQSTSNVATVTFDVQPAGTPPAFLSKPDTLTTIGFPYQYGARVVDLDPGDSVTLTLAAAPPGMTLSSTGRLNWSPDAAGEYAVSLLASDTIGFTTVQSFTLVVGEPVTVPDVVGSPQTAAEDALAAANLLVGSVREATHPTVPAGSVAEQSPPGGAVAEFGGEVDLVVSRGPGPEDIDADGDGFTPNQGDCDDGDGSIFPGGVDDPADGIDANCDGIDGDLDLESLVVAPASSTVLAGQPVNLTATGVFADGTSQNLTGVVAWTNGPSFSTPTPGSYTATATRDGVSGSATIEVVARIAGDQVPPSVTISAPAADATVTEPVDVTGTATDDNFLKYELAYALAGETVFTPIVTSTSPVTNGVLGRFDPTLLINDLYTLRLTVFDRGGNQTVDEVTVQVDGGMKVGHFSLAYVDLEVPLAGLPIRVSRTYDSRDKTNSDFGVGWSVGVQSLRIRANRTAGEGWRVDRQGLVFALRPTAGTVVSLRLPDGRVESFDMVVTPATSPLVPFPPSRLSASFAPRPGTRGQLEVLDNTILSILDPQPGAVELVDDVSGRVFDPDRFRYTAPNGTQYVISRSDGVESVVDRNGNTLYFEADGIFHSSGASIAFDRDDLGRITAITDPAGNVQRYVYDGNGDLRSHVDRNGNTTRYAYDRKHNVLEILGGDAGSVVRNEYDADGRLVRTVDGEGQAVHFERDIEQQTETVIEANGAVTELSYDDAGNVTRRVDALGNATLYTYDTEGNQLSRTNSLGETWQYAYDDAGRITETLDPLGNRRSIEYDATGRVLRFTDENGATHAYEYDSRGNRIAEIDPLGNRSTFAYDLDGNLIAETDPTGRTTRYAYDALGRQISRTDAEGNVQQSILNTLGDVVEERTTLRSSTGSTSLSWAYGYDSNQNLIAEQRPGDPAPSTAAYDANDQLVGATNPLGLGWSAQRNLRGDVDAVERGDVSVFAGTYDANGRLVRVGADDHGGVEFVHDLVGNQTEIRPADLGAFQREYDAAGQLVVERNAQGGETRHAYDVLGRRVSTTRPDGGQRSIEYDDAGRIIRQTDSFGMDVRYEYDAANRLVALTGSDGVRRETRYDSAGRPTDVDLDLGERWNYEYDAVGRLARSTDGSGSTFEFAYDSLGSVETMTMPEGQVLRFEHDGLGRLTSHALPLGQQRMLQYDASGRVIQSTKFDGTVIGLQYDDDARTLTRTVDGGSEIYQYDARGRIVAYDGPALAERMAYDGLGRLTQWQSGANIATLYTRDDTGRVTRIATPSGETERDYDVASRVETLRYRGVASSVDRNALGIPVGFTLAGVLEGEHDYDGKGRALSLSFRSGADIVAFYDYSFDDAGRISRVSRHDGVDTDYSYDAGGRLIAETVSNGAVVLREATYTFDGNGNIAAVSRDGQTTSRTYDDNDRLLQSGGVEFGWDPNGNLISRSDGSVAERYTYDSQDRLVVYERTGPESVTVAYGYHTDGLLRYRRVGSETRYFTWDRSIPAMPMLLEVTDGSGDQIRRYLHDGVFVTHSIDSAGIPTAYVRDHLGSVTARVRAGEVTQIDYDAYGRVLSGGPETLELGYANSLTDPETGLVFMRSRWYDPREGRFVTADSASPDPLRPRTINRYAYVGGDPINRTDPSGQTEFRLASVIVQLSIASTLFAVGDILYRTGPEEFVAGGLGVRRILNSEARGPDARFVPFGVFSANLNAWGIGFTGGLERLQFNSPESKERANYLFFGPSLSIPATLPDASVVGGGVTVAIVGRSAIYNTPKPEHYQGYFVAASYGGSVTGQLTSKVGVAGGGAGALSGFWSPVPTYFTDGAGGIFDGADDCTSCESRYSFGYRAGIAATAGRGTGGRNRAFSFAISYYWLLDSWDVAD
ncbi:FG-GAP-like repeat-containing protein [Wenzhouxiangella sp. XN24]|uniref:PKD domain-containing protein n=1 Tax=Wenzhouxiangella sp. XN24 TaxID=2713569 RepID=UPI0013EDE519|nr:FG-GAP-like repeat-containing protein [Wenzhouxiangella sp. XN24]NGX17232.1 PASTA domain-containing protein [Wenzhouxiangella sp. XN24]